MIVEGVMKSHAHRRCRSQHRFHRGLVDATVAQKPHDDPVHAQRRTACGQPGQLLHRLRATGDVALTFTDHYTHGNTHNVRNLLDELQRRGESAFAELPDHLDPASASPLGFQRIVHRARNDFEQHSDPLLIRTPNVQIADASGVPGERTLQIVL